MVRAFPFGWPGLIGICCSIFLGYSHLSLTGQFDIMESTLKQQEHDSDQTISCRTFVTPSVVYRLSYLTGYIFSKKKLRGGEEDLFERLGDIVEGAFLGQVG